jgi:hypothetical protein
MLPDVQRNLDFLSRVLDANRTVIENSKQQLNAQLAHAAQAGLSLRQIASAAGVSHEAVRKRIAQAARQPDLYREFLLRHSPSQDTPTALFRPAQDLNLSVEAAARAAAVRAGWASMPIAAASLEQVRRQLDQVLKSQRAVREAWDAALPPNWRTLDPDTAMAAAEVTEESGLSLVWVPRASIVEKLVGAAGAERDQVLLENEAAILADLEACLGEIGENGLEELTSFAVEAVTAYRGGCPAAAQALAANVLTTVMHVQLTLGTFEEARREFERLSPDQTSFRYLRAAAIYSAVRRGVEIYYGREDEPIPDEFNRHASTHRVGEVQFTPTNGLASLLLLTSLLRELDYWLARGDRLHPGDGRELEH